MRTLVILLSLALFFLTGLIVGMDRDHQANDVDSHTTETVEEAGEPDEQQVIVKEQETPERPVSHAEEPEYFTQKVASFLESGVKGFYEVIVSVTYGLVQIFY